MDSITNGNFGNFCSWGSGLISSACTHSGCDKQHYHRHCGCALHSIRNGFTGSPPCLASRTVKVSGPARSGMYRSVSVQNFGEKKFESAGSSLAFDFSPHHSDFDFGSDAYSTGTEPARSGMHRSLSVQNFGDKKFDSACSSVSSDSSSHRSDFNFGSDTNSVGRDDLPSGEALMLVEELASFIHSFKDVDSCLISDEGTNAAVGGTHDAIVRTNSTSSISSASWSVSALADLQTFD